MALARAVAVGVVAQDRHRSGLLYRFWNLNPAGDVIPEIEVRVSRPPPSPAHRPGASGAAKTSDAWKIRVRMTPPVSRVAQFAAGR